MPGPGDPTEDAERGDRPSPFADDEQDAPPAISAVDADGTLLAGLPANKAAWNEAWEEATEAPLIAAALSGTFSLAHCLASNEVEEAQSVKAAEAAPACVATWRGDATRLLALAIPIAVTNLLSFCVNAVGVSFVGRLGSLQLSAAVLASSVFNVTGQSIMMGLCGTIDTLAGQAFGARNYRALGCILQRALLVNLAFGAAIAVAWLKSERLFLLLGQEAELSAAAARYMALVAPCLPCIGILEACRRYLLAQGIVRPGTVVTACGAALSPLYNWLLIVRLGLGLDGAALALLAVQLTSALLLGSYVVLRNAGLRGREDSPWHGWSLAALRGWGQYLGLALPSVVMICCKWWSFEALILQAGWFPDAQLAVATMGLCSMTNSVVYMLLFGLSMSASVKISNALGAGCPNGARRATLTCFNLTLAALAAAISALMLLKDRWVRLLTDVEPVVQATVALLPIFAFSLVGDGINVALQSLLRASGRQKVGALTNIISYWLLAIPLAHYLAFQRGWGVQGLWWGIAAANSVQAAIMGVVVARFDYEGEARKAAARFTLRQPLLASGSGLAPLSPVPSGGVA
ncbi:hypothetical protein CHLNCDRAFT_58521 [Chlorella variabilis]|uniref:Protein DETOXIFICATION n=1 Tax=Chlorella variabilis TaxID=554065 RepID=E1ZKU4_CHLVA|nr:hypothetical protein CHLNCDRAFT_58521 [Chlorella variabilis]EFN53551.1 hypothetical protein CHLNCDRAFT_58521 [Chlorella variabilis]|eukprot:XP_005845653.1 hypothetical protein CHLNCDRAFT_58521 [Chlorella variabilis]